MPRINLLPIKAAQQQASAKNEMFAVIGLVLATLGALYLWYGSNNSEINELERKLATIRKDIGNLSAEVKKVEGLKKKEQKVEKKLKVINKLKAQKTGPAKMLHELALILTVESKRVWFISLGEEKGLLRLQGGAMDHEDISEFQLALERREMFTNVRLERVRVKKDKKLEYLEWELVCKARFSG